MIQQGQYTAEQSVSVAFEVFEMTIKAFLPKGQRTNEALVFLHEARNRAYLSAQEGRRLQESGNNNG